MSITRFISLLIVFVATVSVVSPGAQSAPPPPPTPIAGLWFMTLEMEVGKATPELTITRDGDKITGTYKGRYGEFPISGTVRGRSISFSFLMRPEADQPASICFEGELTADAERMSGTADMADIGPATWTATKTKPPEK